MTPTPLSDSWKLPIFIALLLLSTRPALAALGRDATSVQDDQAHMKASLRIARRETAFTVHEIKVPSGTVVREFVSPAGKVFGVAWQGPWLPDLRQLLGDYFEPVLQAPRIRHGRGPLVLNQGGVVFHSTGHMRSFSGRAYLPEILPQGFDPALIQ
jgi:hypothetical protein